MLPLEIFRSRQFTAANLVTFVVYASLGITFFLLVVHLQQVLGYSPLQAGVATLPVTALMLALSARAGLLADRIGPRLPMTAGPLGIAAGLALLSRVQAGDHLPRHGAAGTARVRPRTGADRCSPNRHSACRRGRAARRDCLGREQRDFARRRARRRRGDSRAHRSDRRRLSGSGCLRAWFSHRDADRRRVGRGSVGHSRGYSSATRLPVAPTRARPPSSIAATTARSTARRWPLRATPWRRHAPPLELASTAVLDLTEVSLFDGDVVQFPLRCEVEGIRLVGCPAYIREWMARER